MGDKKLLTGFAHHLSPSYVISGSFSKIIEMAPRLISWIEKAGKERESFGTQDNSYAFLSAVYGWSLGWCGDFEKGKHFFEKALEFAVEMDHKSTLGSIEVMFGLLYTLMGNGESAIKHLESAVRYVQEVKYVHIMGAAWTGLGWAYHLLGEQEEAHRHIEEGINLQKENGIRYHLSRSFFVLGMVHFASGDLRSARESVEKAIELSRDCSERHFEGISRVWLGRILGRENGSEVNKPQEHIYEGIKILDELGLEPFIAQGHLFLGELYKDRGCRKRAADNLNKSEKMFRDMGMDYWLKKTREVSGSLDVF
jgi:tetratricopeptide (TPR) repeat protein